MLTPPPHLVTRYGLTAIAACTLIPAPILAQSIVPDGSQTHVTPEGNQLHIHGGQTSEDGANLLHDFQRFGLSREQIANFQTSPEIQNILGRVTGGEASYIDGLLRVSGSHANLYLLNPAGIVFGQNARLDVPASFIATTATGVEFENGVWLDVLSDRSWSDFAGNPQSFQFSAASGSLVNHGDLAVSPSSNLHLSGNSVVSSGGLTAPNGAISLTATDSGRVRLGMAGHVLGLELDAAAANWTEGGLEPRSLPDLLTGGDRTPAGQLLVTADGSVSLVGQPIVAGDVVANHLTADTASLTATNTLHLIESQLHTGGDLWLSAGDRLRIRDSEANPFVAEVGGDLTIWGDRAIDILAFSHPQTHIHSGGDLTFLSGGVVSADAHYRVGGNFAILTPDGRVADFHSIFDPVLYVDGDVTFGNYAGASLYVEATGSITAGDIEINAIDPAISSEPVLVLRAGTIPSGTINLSPGRSETVAGTTFAGEVASSDAIVVTGDITIDADGIGGLTLLEAPSDIDTGSITSNGGTIYLDSENGGVTASGVLDSGLATGDAGRIVVQAEEDISLDDLAASSTDGAAAEITLYSRNGAIAAGDISATSDAGNGGEITLYSNGFDLTAGAIASWSENGDAGNLTVYSTPSQANPEPFGSATIPLLGAIELGSVNTWASDGNAGDVSIFAGGEVDLDGVFTRGLLGSGEIQIGSLNRSVDTTSGRLNSSSFDNNTRGANLSIFADNEIRTGRMTTGGGEVVLSNLDVYDNSGSIDTRLGTIDTRLDGGLGGNVTLYGTRGVDTGDIFSGGGDVAIASYFVISISIRGEGSSDRIVGGSVTTMPNQIDTSSTAGGGRLLVQGRTLELSTDGTNIDSGGNRIDIAVLCDVGGSPCGGSVIPRESSESLDPAITTYQFLDPPTPNVEAGIQVAGSPLTSVPNTILQGNPDIVPGDSIPAPPESLNLIGSGIAPPDTPSAEAPETPEFETPEEPEAPEAPERVEPGGSGTGGDTPREGGEMGETPAETPTTGESAGEPSTEVSEPETGTEAGEIGGSTSPETGETPSETGRFETAESGSSAASGGAVAGSSRETTNVHSGGSESLGGNASGTNPVNSAGTSQASTGTVAPNNSDVNTTAPVDTSGTNGTETGNVERQTDNSSPDTIIDSTLEPPSPEPPPNIPPETPLTNTVDLSPPNPSQAVPNDATPQSPGSQVAEVVENSTVTTDTTTHSDVVTVDASRPPETTSLNPTVLEIRDREAFGNRNRPFSTSTSVATAPQCDNRLDGIPNPNAIACYERQLRYARNHPQEGDVLHNLGVSYYHAGQYAQAIETQEQYLQWAQENDDDIARVRALSGLGAAYGAIGDRDRARNYYETALPLARSRSVREPKSPQTPPQLESYILRNLGVLAYAQEDYDRALAYQTQSLELARQENDPHGEARSLSHLGLVRYAQTDYDRALNYQQQSLQLSRQQGDRLAELYALERLGIVHYARDDFENAVLAHQQSLELARQLGDNHAEARALTNLGDSLHELGNSDGAVDYLLAAIARWETLRSHLGDDDLSKIVIFETHETTYSTLQEILIERGEVEFALELTERGRSRAFVDLLSRRTNPDLISTPPPPDLAEIQAIARSQNTTLVSYTVMQEVVEDETRNLRNKELQIWVVQPTGEVQFRCVDLRQTPLSLRELIPDMRQTLGVRSNLEGNSGEIALVPGDRVRLQDDAPHWEPWEIVAIDNNTVSLTQSSFPPGVSVDRPISDILTTVASPSARYPRLQQLHALLIAPIADLLPPHPEDRVTFIPHRELFGVPFAALQDENGRFLIERHTILTAPAIQVLQLAQASSRNRRNPDSDGILVVGNPTMPHVEDAPLAPLPATEREATAIAELFDTTPLLGNAATETAVRQRLSRASILHFATHGLLDESRGLDSAIALAPSQDADGFLTAEELLQLDINAELVMLSACNTGQGWVTGDGVVGLSRAIVSAGVPTVIVTLWTVPDAATATFSIDFYRQLQENGDFGSRTLRDRAQALRQAMLGAISRNEHPHSWGAFLLIGVAE